MIRILSHASLAEFLCPLVAIAYMMHKAPFVFPVVGGRKIEHLLQNVEAIELSLSDAQIEYLESVLPFEPGFPHFMIVCLF